MKRWIRCSTDNYLMNKKDILNNLKLLDGKLRDNGMLGEVDLYGGAVMCLGLNARQSTHDIDALFAPKTTIYKLIGEVAEENGLPADWLNDSVKGFASPEGDFIRFGEDEFTNLTVMMTSPKYLLAMKCLSCRMADESSTEIDDIRFLIDYLGLKTVKEVEDILLRYYPAKRVLPKTHYMLAEIFDEEG